MGDRHCTYIYIVWCFGFGKQKEITCQSDMRVYINTYLSRSQWTIWTVQNFTILFVHSKMFLTLYYSHSLRLVGHSFIRFTLECTPFSCTELMSQKLLTKYIYLYIYKYFRIKGNSLRFTIIPRTIVAGRVRFGRARP